MLCVIALVSGCQHSMCLNPAFSSPSIILLHPMEVPAQTDMPSSLYALLQYRHDRGFTSVLTPCVILGKSLSPSGLRRPMCNSGHGNLLSSGGVCETRYLQDGEACGYSGVRDNKCTADTQLGHRMLYHPLLYLDGDLVRWFLVRTFLSAPGSTESRRRAAGCSKAFCALQVGTEYHIWYGCIGLTCMYFINKGKRSPKPNVRNP